MDHNHYDVIVVFSMVQSPTFSPLYRQIKSLIMRSLEQGEWKPGELIPSEVELSQRFCVSQGTVRKAVDELSQDNLLIRRQGKGTFVATHNEAKAHFRFLRLAPEQGGEVNYPESRVLDCKRMRLPADVCRLLDLRSSEPGYLITRLLSFNASPTVLDEIWLPATHFKGLSRDMLTSWSGTLYGFFESKFGVCMTSASERIRAVAAEEDQARQLGVPAGSPLLFVERLSKAFGGHPVELRRGWYVTNHFHYRAELS